MRTTAFSVRWEGLLTPDSTVKNGGLRANPCDGRTCPANGLGVRVWLDGLLVIDAWEGGAQSNVSCSVDWVRGVSRHIVIEYRQTSIVSNPSFFLQWSMLSTLQTAAESIAEAVALAATADAAVVVVGGANNDYACTSEGEGVDRASLDLGGTQGQLLEALAPVEALVTVFMGSKPPTDSVIGTLNTFIAAFQGGQACGQAIAEVILGATEPSGRLPISFPVSAATLPAFYSRRPSSSRGGYCDIVGSAVRFPFGYGLSYTTFSYESLVVATPFVARNGTAIINFTVTNTGRRAGWAVPQLYLRRVIATVTTPILRLKGFDRIFLQSLASINVSLTVDVQMELSVYSGRSMLPVVEPGGVLVYVGPSSAELSLQGHFNITL